ncbi:MAG: hypothetical protein RLZZ540_1031 [Bacteroidota bacterium]
METEIEEIYNQCVQIRKAILKIKDQTSFFKIFPAGCCRDSSIIIAEILNKKGFKDILYCHSEFDDDSGSHAWLEYKNHIIDITADQFSGIREDVIVRSNKTRHFIYQNPMFENYSLKNFSGFWIIDILSDLKLIIKNIESPAANSGLAQ